MVQSEKILTTRSKQNCLRTFRPRFFKKKINLLIGKIFIGFKIFTLHSKQLYFGMKIVWALEVLPLNIISGETLLLFGKNLIF